MSKNTVIILSGGMDSTTLLYDLKAKGHNLVAVTFNYGQKHIKELVGAIITCEKLEIDHRVVDLSEQLRPILRSALTDTETAIPEGHYADDNMKATVVPNRNMIMLSIATGLAISLGFDNVAYAAHSGDHTIYPDCRPEFREAMDAVLKICDFNPISLLTPYMHLDKGQICAIGRDLPQPFTVPYEDTWTCYKGGVKPCGVCGACVERKEAFEFAGIPDPLIEV